MTEFEKKVYRVVKKVPKGKTLSYKEVAVKLGNAGLARAVGNALHKNKNKFVPCHRVIKNNGEIGGWAWGSKKKRDILNKEGVSHEVLNAKNHEREALIVAKAGERGAVTIATNMAGRGTDIKLGEGVKELGGLCIFGTERHEARRIDDQLRGRAGRQGDPGVSQFYISMDDDLMRIFGSDRMKSIMNTLHLPDDQAIENRFISSSIEKAQAKIEGFHFDARKHVLEYDDVMNKQRERIYGQRRNVLKKTNDTVDLKEEIKELMNQEVVVIVNAHCLESRSDWQIENIAKTAGNMFALETDLSGELKKIVESGGDDVYVKEKLAEVVLAAGLANYEAREKAIGEKTMRQIERFIMIRAIDINWMQFLSTMDYVKDSVKLRGYGMRDPLIEYKKEAYKMFRTLLAEIESSVVENIFRIKIAPQSPVTMPQRNLVMQGAPKTAELESGKTAQPETKTNKVGRNELCPCGSGKKFKKCHGK